MEFLTQVRLAGLYSRAVMFLALTFCTLQCTDTLLAFHVCKMPTSHGTLVEVREQPHMLALAFYFETGFLVCPHMR